MADAAASRRARRSRDKGAKGEREVVKAIQRNSYDILMEDEFEKGVKAAKR